MGNWKKLAQGAAGAAGGGGLNVEDVFSTYLYNGTNAAQTITNGIALADGVGGGTSTEFDGSSDYLERSFSESTRTQMTFSAWIYPEYNTSGKTYFRNGATTAPYEFNIQVGSDSNLDFYLVTGNQNKSAIGTNKPLGFNSWHHILFSINTSTGVAQLYIDDVNVGVSNTSSGEDLKPLLNSFQIMKGEGSGKAEGKVAHVFLDYTYRDLSTTSNRRLFIDANGGSTSPSTLSALSPILYLPMTDAYSVGENIGTGGDFTAYGSPTIVDSGTEYLSGYGQGGLVWMKARSGTGNHLLYDTERGPYKSVRTNQTNAENTASTGYGLEAFNTDGFDLGLDWGGENWATDIASWTFRKAPKFFDVVTYTGNGVAGRTISHNLNSAVGMIIVKRTDTTGNWRVLVRTGSNDYSMFLNGTGAGNPPQAVLWGDGTSYVAPTSTEFTIGSIADINASGGTYVAYLFAHNDGDGDFGPTGDQDIIKCGSFTANSSGWSVDLGFEPQWVMIKKSSGTSDWGIVDNMRSWDTLSGTGDNASQLRANLSNAENRETYPRITATGFNHEGAAGWLTSGADYIYVAIRRGPMAVPESATDVFAIDTFGSTGDGKEPAFRSTFPVDMQIYKSTTGTSSVNNARLTQGKYLSIDTNDFENTGSWAQFDYQNGFYGGNTTTISHYYSWMWRRAPNFFDVVAYTGNSTAGRTVSHNLGVAPEMIWIKSRTDTTFWPVYHKDVGYSSVLRLDSTSTPITVGMVTNTSDTTFTLSTSSAVNSSGHNFIAYLFASLDGVSKVGSYTGTSASQTIDCGFSSGARFVLIKETSGAGNWYLFDTERGITSTSNDGVLQLNSTAAELSESAYGYDMLQPHNSGFTLTAAGNAVNFNGADFIFYAIA